MAIILHQPNTKILKIGKQTKKVYIEVFQEQILTDPQQ